MAEEDNIPGEQPQIKSLNDTLVSFVTFHSRIERPVELLWVNYQGKVVNFFTMNYDEVIQISTYVTHPWIVWDAQTHQRYLLNGKPVHFPSPFDPNNPKEYVSLDIPVYSLKECGIQAVRSCVDVNAANMEQLELPRNLINDLKSPPPPGFQYEDREGE